MKSRMGFAALIRRLVIEGGPGGFSFNQSLIVDNPLLFHTRLRKMFPLVRKSRACCP